MIMYCHAIYIILHCITLFCSFSFILHYNWTISLMIFFINHFNPCIRPRSYFLSISDKILRRLTILSLTKFLSYFQITCILLIIFFFLISRTSRLYAFFVNLTQFTSCWFLTDTIFELISAGYFSESKSEVRIKTIFILEIFTNFNYISSHTIYGFHFFVFLGSRSIFNFCKSSICLL